VTCELCGGQAFVDQATLDRYGEGQRLRTDRMRRGLSVRLEAERLGISPSQLTRIEAGYEAMPRAGEPEN
jgi:ribosome-binding protein aMBF1 (putative translation factor)